MLLTVERLMGAAEIAELLGVSRQRVQQLVTRADFPEPIGRLTMGKIWRREDVERWNAARRKRLAGE